MHATQGRREATYTYQTEVLLDAYSHHHRALREEFEPVTWPDYYFPSLSP